MNQYEIIADALRILRDAAGSWSGDDRKAELEARIESLDELGRDERARELDEARDTTYGGEPPY